MIKVGGATEVEVKEKKDRVDDALRDARRSRRIVAGGGVTLLYAAKALDRLKPGNDDQKVGIDIVRKALAWPAKQIVINAGADGSIVAGKLVEKNDPNWGYDAQNDSTSTCSRRASSTRSRSCAPRCRTPPRSRAS